MISFFKHNLVYLFLSVASKLIWVVLIPVLTRSLSVEEYGVFEYTNTLLSFGILILIFNINPSLFRLFYELNEQNQKILFSNIFYILVLMSLLIITFLIIFSSNISLLLFDIREYYYLVVIMAFRLPLSVVFEYFIAFLRINNKLKLYSWVIVSELFMISIGIYYLNYSNTISLQNIFLLQLFSQVVIFLILFIKLLPHFVFKTNYTLIKEAYTLALPGFFAQLIGFFFLTSLPIWITKIDSLEATGYYAVAYKIATVFFILITSFRLSYAPIINKIMAKNEDDFNTISSYIIFFYLILLIPLYVHIEIVVPYVLNHYMVNYSVVQNIIKYIVVGMFFSGISTILVYQIIYTKRLKYVLYIQLWSSIVFILLVYPIVRNYSYFGASLLFLLLSCINFCITYYYSQKLHYVKYNIIAISIILLLCLIDIFIYNSILLKGLSMIIYLYYIKDIKLLFNIMVKYI